MPRETIASLRAECDALREEVARLRAAQASHVCAQPAMPEIYRSYQQTVAAGCAGGNYPQIVMIPNTAGANPMTCQLSPSAYIGAAAGGGMAQQVWFNVGGDCA